MARRRWWIVGAFAAAISGGAWLALGQKQVPDSPVWLRGLEKETTYLGRTAGAAPMSGSIVIMDVFRVDKPGEQVLSALTNGRSFSSISMGPGKCDVIENHEQTAVLAILNDNQRATLVLRKRVATLGSFDRYASALWSGWIRLRYGNYTAPITISDKFKRVVKWNLRADWRDSEQTE